VSVVGKPSLYSLIRSAGALSLYVNGALVPWASNTIGTTQTTGEQLLPFAIGGEPAGPPLNFDGRMQHVFIVRGQRPNPQGDVDFIYREAIRGMRLWDWFSQAYPTTDVFCEFDEDAGGTTLVNRAGADGTYLGGVSVQNARVGARTGLAAKFDGVSGYGILPLRANYVQQTAVFTMGAVFVIHEQRNLERWFFANGVGGPVDGFDFFIDTSGGTAGYRIRTSGQVTTRTFDWGGTFEIGRRYSIALTSDGTNLRLYLDGELKATQTRLLGNLSSFDLRVLRNAVTGARYSPFIMNLAFITPVAMQAHEVMHLHKLTELGGYFDRPDEFLEFDITTGETPLPEPPPPGEGYLLTEDGFILTTENGERIVIEDAP